MLSKSFHKVVQKLCQSFVKVVSKLCLICLKVVSNLFHRCLDIFSLMCQSYHKGVPKLSASCLFGAQVWSMQFSNGANWHGSCPKWCPSVALVVPNWGQKVSMYATMWPRDVLIECLWSCISAQCAFWVVRWPCGQKLKSKNTLSDGKKIFLRLFFLCCFRKKTLKLVSLFIFRH